MSMQVTSPLMYFVLQRSAFPDPMDCQRALRESLDSINTPNSCVPGGCSLHDGWLSPTDIEHAGLAGPDLLILILEVLDRRSFIREVAVANYADRLLGLTAAQLSAQLPDERWKGETAGYWVMTSGLTFIPSTVVLHGKPSVNEFNLLCSIDDAEDVCDRLLETDEDDYYLSVTVRLWTQST